MNLHEYQAKSILKQYGVTVPQGIMVETVDKALEAAKEIQQSTGTNTWAVKAQIHAGGRGKGGGVKIAKAIEDVPVYVKNMIGMNLITHQTGSQGKTVHRVLIEQGIYYPGTSEIKEIYVSILLNRSIEKHIIMYSPSGGMDIENVAEKTPEQIFYEPIDTTVGYQDYQGRKIAFNLGLTGKAVAQMQQFIKNLYTAYVSIDASLIEINPVVKTSDDLIIAADAKVVIEDNALFRHPDIETLRDLSEENPVEVEADKYNLNFIKLDGNVGCIVNGAGLAMATMDIIKLSGGSPANFLDVGGKANTETVEAGFRLILQDASVRIILVNIFGGIVRCDRVASGIVEAYKSIGNIPVPIVVRLEGTNAETAKTIIDQSGLKVYGATTLAEAAQTIKKILSN